MRVTGIFTGTTSSLCLSLRQLPDRYAIRAGRNLPDKEFRSEVCYINLRRRAGHFCQPLHVAMQHGLYLHFIEVPGM